MGFQSVLQFVPPFPDHTRVLALSIPEVACVCSRFSLQLRHMSVVGFDLGNESSIVVVARRRVFDTIQVYSVFLVVSRREISGRSSTSPAVPFSSVFVIFISCAISCLVFA